MTTMKRDQYERRREPRRTEDEPLALHGSAERLLHVLLALAQSDAPLTAKAIAARLDLPLSTVYRYLKTLGNLHFIVESAMSGRYALGPRCVQLASNFQKNSDLIARCYPEMQELARQTGETIALVMPLKSEALCLETIESPQPIRYSFSRGAVRPLLRGASAKALLPYIDTETLEETIAASQLSPAEIEQLRHEIETIRANGYAVSEGEVDPGAWAVGVPLLDADGLLEASLSVIAPVYRLTPDSRNFIVNCTRETGKRLSATHLQEE